jgi:hypothetical protein
VEKAGARSPGCTLSVFSEGAAEVGAGGGAGGPGGGGGVGVGGGGGGGPGGVGGDGVGGGVGGGPGAGPAAAAIATTYARLLLPSTTFTLIFAPFHPAGAAIE